MNKAKRLSGKIAVVSCVGLLLVLQTGCLFSGKRGGPRGLPPLPGLPRVEQPDTPGQSVVTTTREHFGRTDSAPLVQNEMSAEVRTNVAGKTGRDLIAFKEIDPVFFAGSSVNVQ
jgi:hypothetical protein